MKVAVTGCNGYIGSILTEILIERGYDVYGCDWSNRTYTGEPIKQLISPRRVGDPACLIANSIKFACLNEFLYTNSTLKNMIVSSWKHYKSRGELDGI